MLFPTWCDLCALVSCVRGQRAIAYSGDSDGLKAMVSVVRSERNLPMRVVPNLDLAPHNPKQDHA
jgi:hypothetical protein